MNREQFIKAMNAIISQQTEIDEWLDGVEDIIGCNDKLVERAFAPLYVAIDILLMAFEKDEAKQEDIKYLLYEGGGTIEANDRIYEIDEPEDLCDMWEREEEIEYSNDVEPIQY